MTVTVPSAPPLATVRAVPLMHTGQWNASSGVHEFTDEDLAAAVAALDCPAVRRPSLKFGHDGQHGVGLPALGSVDNLALDDDGRTLLGDYVGMPGWLATVDGQGRSVLSSAYPDRSIEGEWDYRCQIGHLHPFVVHAVALLGEERPAIGTLPSLADLADLYGVAMSNPAPTGTTVTLTIHADGTAETPVVEPANASAEAGGRSPMPNPSPTQVSTAVSTEDVRRAYYDAADWEYWITELQIDPTLQLIVTSDRTGEYSRVPVTIDGNDVTFGEPVPVSVVYVDKATSSDTATAAAMTVMASAALSGRRVVYASRAESRPGDKPAADATGAEHPEPAAAPDPVEPAGEPTTVPAAEPELTTDQTEDDVSDLSDIARGLGLPDDAGKDTILAAIAANKPADPATTDQTTDPETASAADPTPPDAGVAAAAAVRDQYGAEVQRLSAELAAIKAEKAAEAKKALFDRAVQLGQIEPAVRATWEARYDKAPDVTSEILASIAPGTAVPVAAAGTTGNPAETAEAESTEFDDLFSTPALVKKG
jgi:hypothetical protein